MLCYTSLTFVKTMKTKLKKVIDMVVIQGQANGVKQPGLLIYIYKKIA